MGVGMVSIRLEWMKGEMWLRDDMCLRRVAGLKELLLGKSSSTSCTFLHCSDLLRHCLVSGLDAFLLHSQGAVDITQLVVEPSGVADRVPMGPPAILNGF
jgi:hypothetical protein